MHQISTTWMAAVLMAPFVGSFIGLVSLRLPAERPVAIARSACGGCGRTLGPLDLVPIFSFLAFRGRCRICASPIPRRYPLIEVLCIVIAAWGAAVVPGWLGLVTAALGWWLLLLSVIDAEHQWLPDLLTLPLGLAGLAVTAIWLPERVTDHLIGAVVGFGALWLIGATYRRIRGRHGLGGGDSRLLGAAGAWVGWAALPSVLLWASLTGLVTAAGLALVGRRLKWEDALPFGPFLAFGLWISWLYGPLTVGG